MDFQKATKENITGEYRPDIDGLRAIAVLAVIFYHYFPNLMPGGFIGVDIFFVISGYLITSIVIAGVNNNNFSFKSFYQRRIRRIFPSLIIVLAFSGIFGWLILLEGEFNSLGTHIYASSLFVQNIMLWHGTSYFDVNSNFKPLLHIWSLSVEEQFYIAYPILLWWGLKKNMLVTLVLLLAITAISFLINIWGVSRHAMPTFYLLPARSWEFLLGCTLNLAQGFLGARQNRLGAFSKLFSVSRRLLINNFLAITGLFVLLAGLGYFDGGDPYPGWRALMPTIATICLISAGQKTWIGKCLGSRIFVFFGLISYPLYLWHYPLLAYTRIILYPNEPELYLKSTIFLFSILLSWATYKYIEFPVRFNKTKNTLKTSVLTILLIIIAVLGIMAANKKIIPRIAYDRKNISEAQADWTYPDDAGKQSNRTTIVTRTIRGDDSKGLLLVGDSHVKQYWSRFEYLNSRDRSLGSVTFAPSVCPPLPNIVRISEKGDCWVMFEEAMQLAADNNIKHVIFGAYWEAYLIGHFGANEKNFISGLADYRDPYKLPLKFGGDNLDRIFDEFKKNISELIRQGKKVTLILSNPTGAAYEPGRMIGSRIPIFMNRFTHDNSVSKSQYVEFVSPVIDRLRLIAIQTGAAVIDPVDYLCGAEKCNSTFHGDPIYMDGNHIRSSYIRDHGNFLDSLYVK